MTEPDRAPPPPAEALPPGIRSRFVDGVNGLRIHLLEAGFETPGRPALLLLHGFPELAWSWRKVMAPLAAAGFHVIAPDQRGYGATTGWDRRYDGDLASFRILNLVRDTLGLVAALGLRSVAAVVGHDFGSPVAAWCALVRPDVFRSVVLMSAPFAGPPSLPFDTARGAAPAPDDPGAIHAALAALSPPRKHYQWYYSTRAADTDMRLCPQGVHDFLRAYYHMQERRLAGQPPGAARGLDRRGAGEAAHLLCHGPRPDMAETVAPEMPSAAAIAACPWLTEEELRVYSDTYARTGFQGGLQWYRCRTEGMGLAEAEIFSGRTIDVPSMYLAGRSDWGVYQVPGAFERMQGGACTRMLDCRLIDGAGHWVQQEQPEAVSAALLGFLDRIGADRVC